MARKRYLSEDEYARLINDPTSDTDENDDSFSKELECDISSDSDTDILSETELAECLPSTSHRRMSQDAPFWTRELEVLHPHIFIGTPGTNSVVNAEKEIDFFNVFFDYDRLNVIVEETNSFAQNAQRSAPSTSKSTKFSNVSIEDIKVFFAMIILMGIIKKPSLKMYFITNEVFATPFFNRVKPRDVFLHILRCLHFTSDASAKKLQKLGLIVDNLKNKFKRTYIPKENICIDESLFAWKGRLGFRQYVPSKRSRYGVKIYKLCKSVTGYVWNFLIYCGKDTDMSSSDGSYGERVVKTLMSDLCEKGYNVYLDRFFNSPSLAEYMHSVKTNVCGTVLKTRKKMPKNFPERKLKKGELDAVQHDNMNIIAFKEKKKDVFMLTSIHGPEISKSGRKDRVTGEDILKPQCILDYNKNMGGIDIGDAVMTHHSCFRKSVKWYKKLFFGLMDITILNSNILFDKKHGTKTPILQFKMKLIEQIFENYGITEKKSSFLSDLYQHLSD
ncbi:PiggyBac transposable element-derived protein 4 [Araneus ventricosus]|uniref:PiggyBac transposable element-derived protein 4 n=1 Tax=Araneus ventricosus TaxID=182803 RepID=A0A4Y2RSI5_ARAVE|nr:PiggyBac transposable element-derived protein 4 [Araneus ventricosus]